MTNSRQKGKRGELELAHELARYGLSARRSQQFKGTADSADVEVTEWPDIHVECKRVQALNLPKAIAKCVEEAGGDKYAAVFHRRNGEPWLVTMTLTDWMLITKRAATNESKDIE
jgi:hypothetical protein